MHDHQIQISVLILLYHFVQDTNHKTITSHVHILDCYTVGNVMIQNNKMIQISILYLLRSVILILLKICKIDLTATWTSPHEDSLLLISEISVLSQNKRDDNGVNMLIGLLGLLGLSLL